MTDPKTSQRHSPAAVDVASESHGTASPPPIEAAQLPKADSDSSPVAPGQRSTAEPAVNSERMHEREVLPAEHWAQLPLEDEPAAGGDADSTFGDTASSTTSLSESILEYRNLHGRTFHSDIGLAESWTPNDEKQQESMDIHHHMCTLALGDKLFLAPLKADIQKALDVGTGTGLWAIDFAEQFPGAEVTGTDLSPIQPTWVPPNVRFEIDDANLPWTWDDNTFDFVHVRALMGSVVDWSKFYRDAFRCCKPGGYIEHFENSVKIDSDDGSVTPGSAMDQWGKVFWAGGEKFGRTFRVVEDDIQRKCMEEAGFADVTVWEHECPIGPWPADPRLKRLGQFARLVLESDAEGYVLYMWNAVMGWSPAEIQVYLAHLRRQVRDNNVHAWYRQRSVYGRKP